MKNSLTYIGMGENEMVIWHLLQATLFCIEGTKVLTHLSYIVLCLLINVAAIVACY